MNQQRLGLALSGGGFRAALFHIGVLAHLAEVKRLHEVESISTVSGGSIVGVLYYIKLKNLLESKTDDEIKPQHYIDLVAELEQDFLAAVQNNLRWKTFSSILHNLRMSMEDYSRSDRIGELYDEYIFRPAWKTVRDNPIMMHELIIHPMTGEDQFDTQFNPAEGHNSNRTNKIPVLNINATVLNTGHDWRFTATSMGEVLHANETKPGKKAWEFNPDSLSADIDKNTRLIYDNYEKLCHRVGGFPLGKAVAASAGVPALFPPLAVSNMYVSIETRTDKPTTSKLSRIQLVDGGVFDNQGIEALINGCCACNQLVISDASGSMRDLDNPGTGIFSVLQRTTDILMGRVRDETLEKIHSNQEIKVLGQMHMTQGLPVRVQQPRNTDCENIVMPRTPVPDPLPGMDHELRGYLSRIRTDLDSFTDVESMSLMAQGYALAASQIPQNSVTTDNAGIEVDWRFTPALGWLDKTAEQPRMFKRQLDIGSKRFAKAFLLATNRLPMFLLASLAFFSGLAIFVLLACLLLDQLISFAEVKNWLTRSHTLKELLTPLAYVGLVYLLTALLGQGLKYLGMAANGHQFVLRLLSKALLPALAAIPVKLYLCTLDKYFLYQGRFVKK